MGRKRQLTVLQGLLGPSQVPISLWTRGELCRRGWAGQRSKTNANARQSIIMTLRSVVSMLMLKRKKKKEKRGRAKED